MKMIRRIFAVIMFLVISVGIAQSSGDPFNRPPVLKDVNIGELLSLTCKAGSNAVAVQWFKDGVLIPGETKLVLQKPFAKLSDAGTYYAEVNYETQCGMLRTNDVIVNVNSVAKLGVSDANLVSLSAPEPNPVNEFSVIKFNMPKSGNAKLVLHDMTGSSRAVLFEGNALSGLNTVEIKPSELNLASGTYFLTLVSEFGNDSQTLNIVR